MAAPLLLIVGVKFKFHVCFVLSSADQALQ